MCPKRWGPNHNTIVYLILTTHFYFASIFIYLEFLIVFKIKSMTTKLSLSSNSNSDLKKHYCQTPNPGETSGLNLLSCSKNNPHQKISTRDCPKATQFCVQTYLIKLRRTMVNFSKQIFKNSVLLIPPEIWKTMFHPTPNPS